MRFIPIYKKFNIIIVRAYNNFGVPLIFFFFFLRQKFGNHRWVFVPVSGKTSWLLLLSLLWIRWEGKKNLKQILGIFRSNTWKFRAYFLVNLKKKKNNINTHTFIIYSWKNLFIKKKISIHSICNCIFFLWSYCNQFKPLQFKDIVNYKYARGSCNFLFLRVEFLSSMMRIQKLHLWKLVKKSPRVSKKKKKTFIWEKNNTKEKKRKNSKRQQCV